MYCLRINLNITWTDALGMIRVVVGGRAIDIRIGKWLLTRDAGTMQWPWQDSNILDNLEITDQPGGVWLGVSPYQSYATDIFDLGYSIFTGNYDNYWSKPYESGHYATAAYSPSGTQDLTLEIAGDKIGWLGTATLYVDGTELVSVPYEVVPDCDIADWQSFSEGQYLGQCASPISYGYFPPSVAITPINRVSMPLRSAAPFHNWYVAKWWTLNTVSINNCASSLDRSGTYLDSWLTATNTTPSAGTSTTAFIAVPTVWHDTGGYPFAIGEFLPFGTSNEDAEAYLAINGGNYFINSTGSVAGYTAPTIYLHSPRGSGIARMPDGTETVCRVSTSATGATETAYHSLWTRSNPDSSWQYRTSATESKQVPQRVAADAAEAADWQTLNIGTSLYGTRLVRQSQVFLPHVLAPYDKRVGYKGINALYASGTTKPIYSTWSNVSPLTAAMPSSYLKPYGWQDEPWSGTDITADEVVKTSIWFDARGNSILGVGLWSINDEERIVAHLQDSTVVTVASAPRAAEDSYAPWPWCYRTSSGLWHVCWLAEASFNLYESTDTRGTAWSLKSSADAPSVWQVINVSQWHGQSGRQYIVGWYQAPIGEQSQVVLYSRESEDADLSNAYFLAPEDYTTAPYVIERKDGTIEIGWQTSNGRDWTIYQARNYTADYTEWTSIDI